MYKEIRFRAMVLMVVLVATSIISSCGSLGGSKSDLEGTRWQLKSMAGSSPAASIVITADFNDGRISGSSGCNSYGATYSAQDGKLSLESVAMTEMACQEAGIMDSEQQYLKILNTVKGYKVTTDQLALLDESGNVVLSFTQQ